MMCNIERKVIEAVPQFLSHIQTQVDSCNYHGLRHKKKNWNKDPLKSSEINVDITTLCSEIFQYRVRNALGLVYYNIEALDIAQKNKMEDRIYVNDINHFNTMTKINKKDVSYQSNCGNGFKLFELKTVVTDLTVTGTSIIQGLVLLPQTNSIYAQHIYGGVNSKNEVSALIKYSYDVNNILEPITRSKSTSVIGHQGLGITKENTSLYFWSTAGSEIHTQRAKYITKFQWNELTGEIFDIKYFKVFGSEYVANASRALGISPDFSTLVVSNAIEAGNIWVIRVFDTATFKDPNVDYSDKYLYEFSFPKRNRPVQSITTDGKYVYVLHGAANGYHTNVIDVFTLSGELILSDDQNVIGQGDAQAHFYYYYEPEVIFILPNGNLGFVTAIGKTGGPGTITPHRNIVSISKYSKSLALRQLDNSIDENCLDTVVKGLVDVHLNYAESQFK